MGLQETDDRRALASTWDGTFNFSIRKLTAVITAISTILGIAILVYSSARAGVTAAVREEINRQIEAPTSMMNRQIETVIHKHEMEVCEPRWNEIRSRLRTIEVHNAQVETKLDIILEQVRKNGG